MGWVPGKEPEWVGCIHRIHVCPPQTASQHSLADSDLFWLQTKNKMRFCIKSARNEIVLGRDG
jgi:hypothetical protein